MKRDWLHVITNALGRFNDKFINYKLICWLLFTLRCQTFEIFSLCYFALFLQVFQIIRFYILHLPPTCYLLTNFGYFFNLFWTVLNFFSFYSLIVFNARFSGSFKTKILFSVSSESKSTPSHSYVFFPFSFLYFFFFSF